MTLSDIRLGSAGNWTLDGTRKVIIENLEIHGEPSVTLDVSRSDAANIRNMLAWIAAMGYHAEEHPHSETIFVTREVIK